MGGRGEVDYRSPCCLTMHQPWASLLVHGIKRIEGRSWPAPLRGRLWIHAAGKVPDLETIKAMEDFYREIYRVNGIEDLKFPEHYPVSQLLGSIDVVGCVKCEELVSWEEVPEGVRLEGQTTLCWLCENPQKLLIPFEMRGNQGVYNLERRIYEQAVRSLYPAKGPLPVKFPLPDSRNPFSLKPGSLVSHFGGLKVSEAEKPPSLTAAIAGARAAATQFSKQQKYRTSSLRQRDISTSTESSQSKNKSTEECARPVTVHDERPQSHSGNLMNNHREQKYLTSSLRQRDISTSTESSQSKNKSTEECARPVTVLHGRPQCHNGKLINNQREQKYPTSSLRQNDISNSRESSQSKNKSTEECARPVTVFDGRPQSHNGNLINSHREQNFQLVCERNSSSQTQPPHRRLNHQESGRPVPLLDQPHKNGHSPHNYRDRGNEMGLKGNSTSHTIRGDLNLHPCPPGAPKIFGAAIKGLRPT